MPASISLMRTYSSAVCERALSPGPSFSEGTGIRAMSLIVGETKVVAPMVFAAATSGWFCAMADALRRMLRGKSVLLGAAAWSIATVSSFV